MVRAAINSLLERIMDRLAMMVGRGVLMALEANGGLMRASIAGIADEVLGDRDFVLDYGISTRPHPGAEALMLFLAGLRSNGMVVRLFDRRYTITLQYGEVAIHDDLGQKVHLTRTGIVLSSPLDVTVTAGRTLRLEGDTVEVHAHGLYRFDVNGHGQVWHPTSVDTWQIGEQAGIAKPISQPEITP